MQTLIINTKNQRYPIHLGINIASTMLTAEMRSSAYKKRIALFSDSQVAPLHCESLLQTLRTVAPDCHLFTFPAGEHFKTRETKARLEDELCSLNYGRDSCFIALGGGVVSDMVGFLSATFCRGVDAIYVPTTLLAMVDASIGGKTAVNTSYGKNLIGAFKQPKTVIIDIKLLETLTRDEWQNGCAEMIKHALIADADLFNELANEHLTTLMTREETLLTIIKKNCEIKARIVEQDTQEKGLRQLLNFGHTIAHGIERASSFKVSHGLAVALGMAVESEMAMQLGFLSSEQQTTIEKLLARYEIDFASVVNNKPKLAKILQTMFADVKQFKTYLLHDKKTQQRDPHFVLLNGIGQCYNLENQYSFPVNEAVLDEALVRASARLC